jgi:hypothetical protein
MARALAGRGRGAAAQASGAGGMARLAVGRGRGVAAQGSAPGLSMDADELGGGMMGAFETDPAIGDAFLASQAYATSGAQRRKRAASNKRVPANASDTSTPEASSTSMDYFRDEHVTSLALSWNN